MVVPDLAFRPGHIMSYMRATEDGDIAPAPLLPLLQIGTITAASQCFTAGIVEIAKEVKKSAAPQK